MRAKPKVRYVLDASAVLAYLQQEMGYEKVREALEAGAVVSTVNLAEVYAKVIDKGLTLEGVATRLKALGLSSLPVTEEDARRSALLYPAARTLGLSLADRVCLALALRLNLPALTADQGWREFGDVQVELIR